MRLSAVLRGNDTIMCAVRTVEDTGCTDAAASGTTERVEGEKVGGMFMKPACENSCTDR